MEALRDLSRRQVDALQAVQRREQTDRGASLKSIAEELRVSSPSALDHLTALEALGLVARHRGKSRITSRGRACLVDYLRHHRVAESLFQHAGMAAAETCVAAREIDLALSHRTVERIYEAEGQPVACPHGSTIPTLSRARRSG
ncbi:MAG: metal-dependent transcriptional regulator [Thermoplasmata archaeon]